MVARMQLDRGISTLGSASQFNYEGKQVDNITEEMARDILNFRIDKKSCFTEDGLIIPRMHYLRRSDGGIIDANCSVGEEFEVTAQPLEILDIAKYIMAQVPFVRIESLATMYNGGTCFVTLSVGDSWLVKGDTSPHWTNIVINNPLTRSKLHLVQSLTRVVCENTLAKACKDGQGYRISHTKNARAMMAQALEGMRYELSQAETTRRMCEFLASKEITGENVRHLLDILYPLPEVKAGETTAGLTRMQTRRDEVISQFESDSSFTDKSFYAFLSANTHCIQHPRHKQARTDDTQVAFENITGGRADFKSKILNAVMIEAMGNNPPPMLGNGDEIIDAEYTMAVA